ncbi:MAG: DUF4876 domain-containing protein [Thioalkalivibrio sp.]|nr:DUF4876 domain-containing protein [Thioalkalivibrio sp.]
MSGSMYCLHILKDQGVLDACYLGGEKMCRTPRFPVSQATGGLSRSTLLVAVAVLPSCGFDGVTEVQRPPVLTADVTLMFQTDNLPEAAALLGWGSGIPDAEITVERYHFPWFFRTGIGTYPTSGFLELYNDSDTTVYLDGKLVGMALTVTYGLGGLGCGEGGFLLDADGIWILESQRFPGSGQDHPLEPGATTVIATDAIDHSQLVDELPDLSGADFEFSGPTGPDNPGVPNMIDMGPRTNVIGHGIIFNSLGSVAVLADALDFESLPRGGPEWSTLDFVRFPRDRILDVAAFYSTYEPITTWCDVFVHPSFDRRPGQYLLSDGAFWLTSINRRVSFVLPSGQKVLQHTRNSEADFHVGDRTPGGIP